MIELAAAKVHFTNQHSKHFQSSEQETMNMCVCVEKNHCNVFFYFGHGPNTTRQMCPIRISIHCDHKAMSKSIKLKIIHCSPHCLSTSKCDCAYYTSWHCFSQLQIDQNMKANCPGQLLSHICGKLFLAA